MTDKNQEIMNECEKIDYNPEDFKLFIGSGFYEVKAYAPQFISLNASFKILDILGIKYDYGQLCGDSYVDRCKNALVHRFLKSDCTHLMIIDSDETWEPEGFARLIKAMLLGPEIVAGLYPCKNNWEFYGGVPKYSDDGYVMGKEIAGTRLIDMNIAPGGFIIYQRKAFERTRPILDSYLEPESGEYILEAFRCNIEMDGLQRKTPDQLQELSKDELIQYISMACQGGRKGKRIGEDIYFQQRYKEMGGMIWCEPNISMGHFGIKEWTGNFQEHLLKQKAKADAERSAGESQAETEQMLNDISENLKKIKAKNEATS